MSDTDFNTDLPKRKNKKSVVLRIDPDIIKEVAEISKDLQIFQSDIWDAAIKFWLKKYRESDKTKTKTKTK